MSDWTILGCSVCFGDPASPLAKGAMRGALFLVCVVAFVLTWIGTLIFVWARRARRWEEKYAVRSDTG